MFKVIEKGTGYIIDSFPNEKNACHFAFLLSIQDRKDGCYKKNSYEVVNPIGEIICLR